MLHRTGGLVAAELEPTAGTTEAARALERLSYASVAVSSAATLVDACQRATEEVRAVTGYDRIMIYRFAEDQSGSVLAEVRSDDAQSYLHHRFPASDIPSQARELYRRSLIRVIPDVSYAPACVEPPVEGKAIDMTHIGLRSVSPVHIQYLKNMGVSASMSISLLLDGELWGLIACHNAAVRLVDRETQLMCRHIGAALSAYIQNGDLAERALRSEFQSSVLEQTLAALRASRDPEQHLRASAAQLGRLVDSGGVALLAQGELIDDAGTLPSADVLREMSSVIDPELAEGKSIVTHCFSSEIGGPPEAVILASGVLAIRIESVLPLTVVWTKPEKVEEIPWAGNPHLKEDLEDSTRQLTPRRSFSTWREIVRGRSRPWTWHEVNSAESFKVRAESILQQHRLERINAQLAEANCHLGNLATTDPLTGLPNRRLFDERASEEWARCLRTNQPLAIIVIDIDNFKKCNDSFGHPAGNECLKRVSAALMKSCRTGDLVARVGGEEFALLLPVIDNAGASGAAERVRLVIEQLKIVHPLNGDGLVTISLGLAEGTPADWGDLSVFLKAADEALYEAKAGGRNRCVTRRWGAA
jgi:diguanylate cyclase (GGDEF)-like protein